MTRATTLLLVLIAAASCGKKSPTSPTTPIPPGASTVLVPNGTAASGSAPGYNPTPLAVAAGTSVTWGNNDSTAHTTTSDAAGWNATVNPGATTTVKFDAPGTFAYHCTIHAFMKGTIVVQ